MTTTTAVWILIGVAFVAANLPWLSERIFFVKDPGPAGKRAWWRWAEWLVLFLVTGAIALGMEQKLNGDVYPQGWEFYAVGACLFVVLALPGFIYRHDLRRLLVRR